KILNQLKPQKIGFNTRSGAIFVDPEEIIYIHAERNYSDIFLIDDKDITVSLYVSEVFEKLPATMFFRISRSAFINTKFIKKLDRKKRLVFLEADGTEYQLKVGLKYIKDFERFSA
ncbi:MAG: LytTR family transcriptional regulator DNA-binding domain-containing protein, partial [Bacteroidales bacterium]|nr:LytTR family transcriptional regulator DNA-binding domain-containing protein [Bacteroidales bacterium]